MDGPLAPTSQSRLVCFSVPHQQRIRQSLAFLTAQQRADTLLAFRRLSPSLSGRAATLALRATLPVRRCMRAAPRPAPRMRSFFLASSTSTLV
ncbi:MAG TPA: hypothetical protein VLQ80_07070 [Candidatus Saccharimonadia bacterium]|nr:hypothetical protein [Candidatus Saccharimonadia bacterium]